MTRKQLEEYLGKKVQIEFKEDEYSFNNVIEGVLYRTHDERFKNNFNIYCFDSNCYVLEKENGELSVLFKVSHIKKCKEI